MEIVVSTQDEAVIVEPKGRIDSTTSREFGDRLLDLIRDGAARVVIDFSHVVYISSAGFRALLIAAKDSAERNSALVLCSMSQEIHRLFEMGAFLDLFRIVASRDEGLAPGG